MKYQPHVTVLIPIRNVGKYIKECLDALMNQTYPKDKFIVWLLDNKSDDGTLDIVAKYPKDRVKIIQMGVHSPPIKYNKMLPRIKSKIVGFVDGDANVDKYWLERVIKPLKNKKVAGASGVILTANNNKLIPRLIGYELQDRYERLPKEIKRIATMHVVYKRKVLEEIKGFIENLKTGYDCEIGYRINKHGYKIIFVKDAKVSHNHRENLWAFFKQQYEYGKFGIPRYFQMPKNVLGDSITPFRMIIQPVLYFAFLILIPIIIIFKLPFWIFLIPIALLVLGILFSVIRLTIKFKKIEVLLLFFIFLIRPFGWGLGAFIGIIRLMFNIKYETK